VISEVLGGRAREIASGCHGPTNMISIEIKGYPSVRAESGLEADATLDGPPAGCDLRQARQQALESGLSPKDIRRRPEPAGTISKPRFDCRAKAS
jgi:hypothetical protein